jgi:hypothetical protein
MFIDSRGSGQIAIAHRLRDQLVLTTLGELHVVVRVHG